jgi:hypothetical protein
MPISNPPGRFELVALACAVVMMGIVCLLVFM